MSRILTFIGAQTCWWACVLLADTAFASVAVVATLAWVGLHVARTTPRRVEVVFAVAATVLGIVVDSALVGVGAMAFPPAVALGPLPTPLWMVALWTGFSTMLGSTLRPVVTSWPRSAVFGAIGGPLSYLGGERLGPLVIAPPSGLSPMMAVGVIAFAWALAMVVLSLLSRRLIPADTVTPVADGG